MRCIPDRHRNHVAQCLALALPLLLCACVTSPQGRPKITPPAPVSDVYSEADMRLHLATIPSIKTPCADQECELNWAFDQQVQFLGSLVAAAAYDAHPDLIKRIKRFEFKVAEKKEPGVTSNASGKIIVLRGTQQIGLNEEALAFVIAREMGHVISQHHEENATTRILLSVAAGVLFPALNLFGNTATVAQATSASTLSSTTVATTAASTATSYLGAKLVMNRLKPEQLSEADQVALNLLGRMGWSHRDLAVALEHSAEFDPSNAWSEDFRTSIAQVKALETAIAHGESLPEIPVIGTDLTLEEAEGESPDLALRDIEGNLLPPLEDPQEATAEALPAPLVVATAEPAASASSAMLPLPAPVPESIREEITPTPETHRTESGPAVKVSPKSPRTKKGKSAKIRSAKEKPLKATRAGKGKKPLTSRKPAQSKKTGAKPPAKAEKRASSVRSTRKPRH